MARNYKTGLLLTGDASGAVRATKLTREELFKLNATTNKSRKHYADYDRSVGKTSKGLKFLRTEAGRAIATLGGFAAVVGGVRTISGFSQEISTLQAVSGASEAAMASLREETQRLGSTTRFTATQAAEGATFLARAGFDSNEILDSLNNTLLLAQSGNLELASAADIASNVLKGFQKEAGDAAEVVDILALAANSSNTNVEQLGSAMSFVAPVAAAAKVELSETAAAVGVLSDAGIQAERAGTGLRQILIELASESGELNIEGKTLAQVLDTLAERNTGLAEATELVGKRQAAGLLVLIKNRDRLKELTEELDNADGTARQVAITMDDNLNGAMLRVASATEGAILKLGDLGAENGLKVSMEALADSILFVTDNLDLVGDGALAISTILAARLAPSVYATGAAFAFSTAESIRYQATLASMAGVSKGAALSTGALNAAMAALGGPLGVGLAISALGLYIGKTLDAVESNTELSASLGQLQEAYKKANAEQRAALELDFAEQLQTTAKSITNVTAALDDLAAKRKSLSDQRDALLDNGADESNILVESLTKRLEENEEAIIRQKAVMAGLQDVYFDTQTAINGLGEEVATTKDKVVESGEAAAGAATGVDKLADSTVTLIDSLEPLRVAYEEHQTALKQIDALEGKAGFNAERLAELRAKQTALYDAEIAKINGLTTSNKKLGRSLDDVLDSLDPLRSASREYKADLTLLEAALAKGGDKSDEYRAAIAKLKKEFQEASDPLKDFTEELADLVDELDPAAKAQAELDKKSALLRKGLDENKLSVMEYNKQLAALKKSYADAVDPMSDLKKEQQELLDELLPLTALQREYREELELTNEALDGAGASEEDRATALANLRVKYEDLAVTIGAHRDQAADVAQSWERAMERVDTVFADAWTGAFDSFESFKDQLIGSFKELIGEMAHAAISRPILIGLGLGGVNGQAQANGGSTLEQLLGGGGSSGFGSNFTGGLSSLGGGVNAGLNGLLKLGTQFGASATGGFSNFVGNIGANTQALGGNLSGGSLSGNAATGLGALTTAAAGVVGSYVGNAIGEAVFSGKEAESSTGSTVGAIGGAAIGAQYGSIGGPIGAAIGAVVGALIDVAAGGDGKKRTNTGILQGPSVIGEHNTQIAESGLAVRAFSRRGDDEAAVAFQETILTIDAGLSQIARSAGIAFDFTDTTLAGKDADAGHDTDTRFFGLKGYNGPDGDNTLEESAGKFVQAWLAEIEDQLPSRVKNLLPSIQQTAQDLVSTFEAVVNIDNLLNVDVVNRTQEAVEELTGAQRSLLEEYDFLTESVLEHSGLLDDGAESYVRLNSVLIEQKNIALALTLAYTAVGEQINATFGNAIDSIKEQLLTEEELYNHRRDQIAQLTAQLQTTVDPQAIGDIVAQLDQLSSAAFSSLDEDQKATLGQEFIGFLEDAREIAQERIDTGLTELSGREQGVVNTIDFELINAANRTAAAEQQAAAEAQQLAAATQQAAAFTIEQAAQAIQEAIANGTFNNYNYGVFANGIAEANT